jgi:hypothetical protein
VSPAPTITRASSFADDGRRVIEAARFHDQRLREEGADDGSGNAGNGRAQRFHADPRLDLHHVGRASPAEPPEAREREALAPLLSEPDHVARVDTVRVLDPVLVHVPDVGPLPRILQELAGDSPEGVAFLDV